MKPRIRNQIDGLMKESKESQSVKLITYQIAVYKSCEKLKQWISSHLTSSKLDEELKKKRNKKKAVDLVTIEQTEIMSKSNDRVASNPVFNLNSKMPSEIILKFKNVDTISNFCYLRSNHHYLKKENTTAIAGRECRH